MLLMSVLFIKKFVLVSLNLSYRQIRNFGFIIIDAPYYFKY